MRTLLRLVPAGIVLAFISTACASTPVSCAPYVCNDGTEIARCTEDGTVINYFAAPCMTHGGESEACSKEQCGPAMGMPNWQCPDGSVGGPVCGRDDDGRCGWRVHDCPNDSGFSDVPTSHPNSDAIFYMKSHGIVEGYADGTFRPDNTINRAEFTKILVVAQERGEDCIDCIIPFSDVPHDAWYSNVVLFAHKWGFVSGYQDGTFRPANMINFAEAAKILSKSFNLEAITTIPACDGECPWYRSYVLMLEMKGAIPTSITRFGQNITRGEMAEMIYRLKTGNKDKPSRTYEELSESGVSNDSLVTFTSDVGGFSLKHRLDWTIGYDGSLPPGDVVDVGFNEPVEGTRLEWAWMHVKVASSCPSDDMAHEAVTSATYNGVTFTRRAVGDSASGGERNEGEVYTAERSGHCYVIKTSILYRDPSFALDTPDVAAERQLAADKAQAEGVFQQMLESFVIR